MFENEKVLVKTRNWVGLALVVMALALVWQLGRTKEPRYGGKKLSVLLDELRVLQFSTAIDSKTPQVQAVRAIGTNAIPWLLQVNLDLKLETE